MKPPIVILALVAACTVLLSCSKTSVSPDDGKIILDTTLLLPVKVDFREKYIGVYKLDVTHRRVSNTKTTLDTVYKNKYYTFFYRSTDSTYYNKNGATPWYRLPAIRVSIRDDNGITDTTKYELWGIKESNQKNEVIVGDYVSTIDSNINKGGFISPSVKFSTYDSIYIDHAYTSPTLTYIYNYKGRKVK